MTASPSATVWHPFTQHALEVEMLDVARADGAWLTTKDGRRVIDGISSWWVITHGHCHPLIVAAIQQQAETLDQVIFAGFTHEPAENVARDLISLAPDGLAHVFFSDSGSTAVEVAVKMAIGYWHNIGDRKRTRILALDHAYHGDTIGTMSAGARSVFNAAYEPLLYDVGRLPYPCRGQEQLTFDALERECRSGRIAALIVEPLILGAGGMLLYGEAVLRRMREICTAHDVLLIADEVMTGFGRTGRMFACDRAGIAPDIMCLAKGLTGGSIPLAVTLCTTAIYEAHYSHDRSKTFFHSSSYTANPIACAAAVANLGIWRNSDAEAQLGYLADWHAPLLARVAEAPYFANPRQIGTITAIDVAADDPGYLSSAGLAMRKGFMKRGVLLRPLGSTIYVMPPYCTTKGELEGVYSAIAEVVKEVMG